MPKQYNMRWKPADEKQLSKAVQKFNAKITRELNKNFNKAPFLPQYKYVAEVKESIKTRQDYNRFINKVNRAFDKGAFDLLTNKQGMTITKYERKEVGIELATLNRYKTRERERAENLETSILGKPTGLKRGEMGDTRTQELKKKKLDFDKIRSKKEWDMFTQSVEKGIKNFKNEAMKEHYKSNYVTGLKNEYGEKAKELVKIIEQLPADIVVDTYYSDETASIDFIYDPLELDNKIDRLLELWEPILEVYLNDSDG